MKLKTRHIVFRGAQGKPMPASEGREVSDHCHQHSPLDTERNAIPDSSAYKSLSTTCCLENSYSSVRARSMCLLY